MDLLFLLTIFLVSIAAFILAAVDKRHQVYSGSGLSEGALLPLAIFGPFGTLCGMIFFGNRKKGWFVILTVVMLLLWTATALLVRF